MEETALPILELGAVFLAAAVLGYFSRRVGLPAVIGYLMVGLVAFQLLPEGSKPDEEQVRLLADVGVVLLLFEVGIELDVGRLRREHRSLLAASPLQILVTTAIAGMVLVFLGLPLEVALVLGLCVAMSSSVVVVNITRSKTRRTNKVTEMSLLGWSLLQDLTGVILGAFLLAIWNAGERDPIRALVDLGLFSLLAVIAARIFPAVLGRLSTFPDLFLLVSIAAGLIGAGVGSVVFGIPLALAAFVAGLVIADSPMAGEARRRLLPFRDVFAVLFFVSVGSLLDPDALLGGLGWMATFVVLMVVAKTGVIYLFANIGGLERPSQIATGLSQLGEFSFVLVTVLFAAGDVTPELYAGLLATITLTIGASAVAVRLPVKGWVRGSEEHHDHASSPAGMA
ncbi:MAG: potassium transporter Kef [Planctomycetota bacterium]|nr:MAG: potassium transporter Kef [Planctomycetota bacterium]